MTRHRLSAFQYKFLCLFHSLVEQLFLMQHKARFGVSNQLLIGVAVQLLERFSLVLFVPGLIFKTGLVQLEFSFDTLDELS